MSSITGNSFPSTDVQNPIFAPHPPVNPKYTKPPRPQPRSIVSQPSSLPVSKIPPSAQSTPSILFDNVTLRVQRSVSRSKITDVFKAVIHSRIFKAVICPALGLAGLFAAAFFLGFTPPGWVITAVAASGFAIGLLLPEKRGGDYQFTLFQDLGFELKSFARLFIDHSNKITEVTWTKSDDPAYPKPFKHLYTGQLPNRNGDFGEYLMKEKEVGAVLSIVPRWKNRPVGFFIPYRHTDWNELGVNCAEWNVDRPTLDAYAELDHAAKFIHFHIGSGETEAKNVYVCDEDGLGRQAIAAYLMKYQGKLPHEVIDHNLDSENAQNALRAYYNELQRRKITAFS